MTRPVWIEVALNGSWSRRFQPNVPQTVDEIVKEAIACVHSGAAIVHAHPLAKPGSGLLDNVEDTVAFIDGIKSAVDAIVYPSLFGPMTPPHFERCIAPIVEVADRGLSEWMALDPGSWNYYALDDSCPTMFESSGGVIAGRQEVLELGAKLAASRHLHIAYACYEPGFVRLGNALHKAHPGMPTPVYRLMFSSSLTFGLPPSDWALEAYARTMREVAPSAPWMLAGLAVDVLPFIPQVVELGGHVRVGLEDAPFGSTATNKELVEAAVAAVESAGGVPATSSDVRDWFG